MHRAFACVLLLSGCGAPGPTSPRDAGALDAGPRDAGAPDASVADGGWQFVSVAGSQCARGAQAGIAYQAGAADQLVVFLQGGGACWNNGTCQPSLFRWGPICNYGADAVCLWDEAGGTKPLAVAVSHPDPYPADGGGLLPGDLAVLDRSLLFSRRSENPLGAATFVFVPYCTGDLHAGDATQTYFVKAELFSQPVAVTHHFAGAKNLDAYLAWLRARHPSVHTLWLMGVSGGGYGATLNLQRVRRAFPEAQVHLLADSAPMLPTPHFAEWATAWNLQVPEGCAGCDGGLPAVLRAELDDAPGSRVALLSWAEDAVITRFFYAGGDTGSWLNPPFGVYAANLVALEATYDARANARYFRLPGQEHVMVQKYGELLADGGLSAPVRSPDGGTDLRAWLDAWATGTGAWESQR